MTPPRLWALACVSLLFPFRVASQQTVKIDDANIYNIANPNGIQFGSKGWSTVNPENLDRRYDGTYTWSQEAGANLIFLFRGTGIAYYADKGPGRGPVGISIDGNPYTNVTWANVGDLEYQQRMWGVSGLTEGDHQIVLSNVGTGDPLTSIMGVDYFEVLPGADGKITPASSGPGASDIPSDAVLVDDSSNLITYTESWSVYSSYDHVGLYLGGTQHTTATPGGVMTFKFNGTAVWYFCDRYESNAALSISIDGAPGETVNTAASTGIWLTQMLTWNKTRLTDGPHTVTITHAGAADTYANVDFFKYMPSVNSPPAGSASTSVPVISASGTSGLPTRPPPTGTPGSEGSATSSSNSTPIGAIVGGVVGGVAVIALILGLLIWRWRRRPTKDVAAPQHEAYAGDVAYGGKEAYAPPGSPYAPPGSPYAPTGSPYAPTGSPYAQSPSGDHGFAPTMNYQSPGMYAPVQTPNMGGPNSVTPTTWTGATYAGYPEIQ